MKEHPVLTAMTRLYPVWLVLVSALALWQPALLSWFKGPWIFWALATVMLGMGFTLTLDDFRRLLVMPACVALGFVAQYSVMPLAGWGIARGMALDPGLAVGLILVASCPGGTASNVIAYLARANVALSVVLTMASTLLAFIMTPLWCQALAGTYVAVDAAGLCVSTLQMVVLPVVLGAFCNWRFPRAIARISQFGPAVSVLAIIFITGGIVAQSAPVLAQHATKLVLAVTALHITGFVIGYIIPRLFRFPADVARTVSIEVGMQNGGMAATLAKLHFPAQPLAAIPAVFSALLQNVIGSLLAARWRSRPITMTCPTSPCPSPPTSPVTDPL